jgi:type I restriction enzyme R subunit
MPTPEQTARERIDAPLTSAGWQVQDAGAAFITAAKGVAIREFPLQAIHGTADYLLYVDGKAGRTPGQRRTLFGDARVPIFRG